MESTFQSQEATEVIDDYFDAFHNLKSWIEDNQKFIAANGFVIVSLVEKGDYQMSKVQTRASNLIAFALVLISWFSLLHLILTFLEL